MDKKTKDDIFEKVLQEIAKGTKIKELMGIYGAVVRKNMVYIQQFYFAHCVEHRVNENKKLSFYHVLDSGMDLSYFNKIRKEVGEDTYVVKNIKGRSFRKYIGESVLFVDNFNCKKSRYSMLLDLLDHKVKYIDITEPGLPDFLEIIVEIYMLFAISTAWTTIHVANALPPEILYDQMVDASDRECQPIENLLDQIDFVVFHYQIKKDGKIIHKEYKQPGTEYITYENLKKLAIEEDAEYGYYT